MWRWGFWGFLGKGELVGCDLGGGLIGEGEVQVVGCSYTLVHDEEAPGYGGACVRAEVNV